MFLAAAVQMNSTSDVNANWSQVRDLVVRAAKHGASLVATPENTNFLGPHADKVRLAEPLNGPTCARFGGMAAKLGIHLLLGSFNEKIDDPARCCNTSILFGPNGAMLAKYRKIHLFDVNLNEKVRFQESATVQPGNEIVVAETALGKVGLSICYDLRFSSLYRQLHDSGAQIFTIPSAFTETTGKAHWRTLISARAIEFQSYVIAPGQYGSHDDQGLRESYGHSSIVDPWGQVLAEAAPGSGLAFAEIDVNRVERLRAEMPLATHRQIAESRLS